MAVDTNSLAYLIDPFWQGEGVNGKPLVAGYMCVYIAGTDQKYITWQNWDGTRHPFKIPLGSDGRATILAEVQYTYDCYLYDSFGNLVCSRLNVKPAIGGDVTVYGLTEVWHDGTMSGEGTPQSPLSVVSAGKVYDGIEPIVVNNIENKISANHVPLGVQDPLYFVQDDEEGCIIGFSGQTIPEGVMSESALGFEDNKITGYNGSAFSAGNEYEAGSYIDIDNNTINVTGLQPEGDYAYNSALSSKLDVTALPQDLVHSGDLTAYQPVGDYQTAGNYLSATDSANFLLTSDSGNFYPMTGNPSGFLTAHQSLQGYATEQWVEDKGYITGIDIQESAGWNEATTVVNNNSAIWNNTTNVVSSNSAQWGASNPQIPVTGINGIKISESGDKVVFEVSADYALADDLTGKQDSLTFGYKDTAISSIDNSALYDNSAHARVTTLAGRISDLSSNKLDTTAFSDVSGTFLTAVDLTPYQTTAGMTAYQSAGDYLTTADSANFYTTANESGFITGVDLSDYALSADVSNELSNKLDTTAFSDVSGSFLTAVDIPQSATWNEVSTTVQSNSAQWAEGGTTYTSPSGTIRIAGDTLEGTTSAVVGDSITDVVDNGDVAQWMVLTALPNYPYGEYLLRRSDFQPDHEIFCVYGNWNYTYYEYPPVNETFSVPLVREGYPLTQIQSNGSLSAIKDNKQVVELALKSDLTAYQTTADMTAYQPTGDYLTTADSANFYTTANESGFISEVPAGTMNESAFEYDANDKISGYNGSAFAGGSDVPEGVMVESGLEYNAVNEISGYNGSAIAQYGAEKQFLQHDDTIVHVANSAQYAFGVNLSAVAQLLGIDETVLYSGNRTQSAVLSDSIWNYNRIGIYAGANGQNISNYQIFDTVDISSNGNIIMMQNTFNFEGTAYYSFVTNYSALDNGTTLYSVGADGIAVDTAVTTFKDNKNLGCIKKVIGIGRKQ